MLGASFTMNGTGSKMQTVQNAEGENTGSRGAAGKDTETENPAGHEGRITEISCNLDDMTGEDIAFAAERILQAGALDVFTESIYMKKGQMCIRDRFGSHSAAQGDSLSCNNYVWGKGLGESKSCGKIASSLAAGQAADPFRRRT